MKVQNI